MSKIVINDIEYTDDVDKRFAGCEFCDVRSRDYYYYKHHCLCAYSTADKPCGNALYLKRVSPSPFTKIKETISISTNTKTDMTTRELMLDDWVYDRILKGNTKIVKITANHIRGDIHEQDYPLTAFEPIPLTDEILKKNGFKPQGTGWILEDSIGERIFNLCRISNAYCLLTAGMTLAFQSVHELQHLFRLAGMKREIKL